MLGFFTASGSAAYARSEPAGPGRNCLVPHRPAARCPVKLNGETNFDTREFPLADRVETRPLSELPDTRRAFKPVPITFTRFLLWQGEKLPGKTTPSKAARLSTFMTGGRLNYRQSVLAREAYGRFVIHMAAIAILTLESPKTDSVM